MRIRRTGHFGRAARFRLTVLLAMSRLTRALRPLARPLPRPLRPIARVIRPVHRQWRRSLTLRVVASTLIASAIVVGILGVLLLDQVGRGLVDAKRKASLAEFAAGVSNAQSQLDQTDATTSVGLDPLLETIVNQLSSRGNGVYSVALLPTNQLGTGYDSGETGLQIPSRLRQSVVRNQDEASTFVRLPAQAPDTLEVPDAPTSHQSDAFVVGAPLNATTTGDSYELYFVFPLGTEQQTLTLVQNTLFAGGGVLIVLLAGIAALVARQVVTPIRVAARAAARLSAGHLEERMRVRGEDDLARLGRAFNDMAGHLQNQIRRLEELSRVQQRFTSDVSHELRTPLTTVRMAADVLYAARSDFDPVTARSAELLTGELARFEALLVDLLEISRYDAGAATLEIGDVDLCGLVRNEVRYAAYLAAERGSDFDMAGIPAVALVAEMDARRVSRILRNLLSNAVEHGEGRPIEVAVAADEFAIAVRVRDHGVGLAVGEAGQVFGRFWRGDPSRARRTGGTGLGLSIALEDARLHGGWLQAWGRPGAGAVFRLVLPRVAGAPLRHAPLRLEPEELEVPR